MIINYFIKKLRPTEVWSPDVPQHWDHRSQTYVVHKN